MPRGGLSFAEPQWCYPCRDMCLHCTKVWLARLETTGYDRPNSQVVSHSNQKYDGSACRRNQLSFQHFHLPSEKDPAQILWDLDRLSLQTLKSKTFPAKFTVGGAMPLSWKISSQNVQTLKITDRLMDANMNLSKMWYCSLHKFRLTSNSDESFTLGCLSKLHCSDSYSMS